MSLDPILCRLSEASSPEEGQKERIRATIMRKIDVPAYLNEAKKGATPTPQSQTALWQKVLQQIDTPSVSTIFDRLREALTPTMERQSALRGLLISRLSPVPVRSSTGGYYVKWVAAFALVLMAVRLSPVVFLAPHSSAQSAVLVLPTKGEVSVSLHGLWQPLTEEIEINESVQVRTEQGEATILLHDDGTIRMAPGTTITLYDLSDRPEPALDGPTLTVTSGQVWVQGLLPSHVRGISIATPDGAVSLHSGSMSVSVDEATEVRVWDRNATVNVDDEQTLLVSGERTILNGNALQVRRIDEREFSDEWASQNLQRDAVHQREVAQMQQERRAAQAGILPTSPLYGIKRVAEKVDVLFTLDPELKVEKQLAQASTRLDEAAALINEGHSGALLPLEEYKVAMMNIASGSGGDSVTQFLLRQQIAENSADLSAALPEDSGYLLKKTVLEASADLPSGIVDTQDVQGILLVDALDSLQQSIISGDVAQAEETFATVKPFLTSLEDEDGVLKPDIQKEILSILSGAAKSIQEASGTGESLTALADELEEYLPVTAPPVQTGLSDEEVDALVAQMVDRIFVYTQRRSRWNQLEFEMQQIMNHPDAGRILRRLSRALPENGLAVYVEPAIQELRDKQEN